MRFVILLIALLLTSAKEAHGKKNLLRYSDAAERDEEMFSQVSLLNKARELGEAVAERKDLELNDICPALETLFQDNVSCRCDLNITQASSISCALNEPVCTPNNATCGRPSWELTMEAAFRIDEITVCVYDYKQNGQEYDDLCVTADFSCNDNGGSTFRQLCDCSVSYGNTDCKECNVCTTGGFPTGIELDCTNINAEVVTLECLELDFMDFSLDFIDDAESGSIRAFLPELEGICTQLEDLTSNAITCDCSANEGETFDLSCETNESQCAGNLCGQVSSTVSVVNGTVDEVTACVELDSPFTLDDTCTTLTLCPDKLNVCGCSVIYNGTTCDICEVCDLGDGKTGVNVDCSNADEGDLVIKGGCQEVTAASSYSYVPEFEKVNDPGNGSSAATKGLTALSFTLLVLGWMV